MTIILTLFLMISPPSVREMQDAVQLECTVEFIEQRIVLTPEQAGNGHEQHFSIWMPSEALASDFVLVSHPGVLTHESIMFAYELLRSL